MLKYSPHRRRPWRRRAADLRPARVLELKLRLFDFERDFRLVRVRLGRVFSQIE